MRTKEQATEEKNKGKKQPINNNPVPPVKDGLRDKPAPSSGGGRI